MANLVIIEFWDMCIREWQEMRSWDDAGAHIISRVLCILGIWELVVCIM